MADWQLIDDTTPKNKRIMLLVPVSDTISEPAFGQWNPDKHNKNPNPFWEYEGVLRVTWMRARQPTHWQPAPESVVRERPEPQRSKADAS